MFHWPKSRSECWVNKINANRAHDEAVQDKLRELGWRDLLVWECTLKGKTRFTPDRLLLHITNWLKGGNSLSELPPA